MKQYDYRAKNAKGKTVTGLVEAPNADQAAKLLRSREMMIISIIPP